MAKDIVDNPDYMKIILEISLGNNKYKHIKDKLFPSHADSTFSEKISEISRGLNLINTRNYNHKKLEINYKGFTAYLFKNYFRKEMKAIKKGTKYKIDYDCPDMRSLFKELLKNHSINEGLTIREFFDNIVSKTGQYVMGRYDKNSEMLRVRKKVDLKIFEDIYSNNEEFKNSYNLLLFNDLDISEKILVMKEVKKVANKIDTIKAFGVLGLLSLVKYCKLNNIDLAKLLIDRKDELNNKL